MKIYILIAMIAVACNAPVSFPDEVNSFTHSEILTRLIAPEGFKVSVYADNVLNARSITSVHDNEHYVGTRSAGNVYRIKDIDGDHSIDELDTIMSGANMPNGVAYRDGNLYVAEVNQVSKFENIEQNPGTSAQLINTSYPSETHHGWKFISIGPDGKLYIPVGAPCNICESEDPIFNTITRINLDGSGKEIVHEGIRNTVGFTWHPETQDIWFTDNGRDWMGDDQPSCELNSTTQDGGHFGYPYCHQGNLSDPEFGEKRSCSEFIAPVQNLDPHSAPLGCEFFRSGMFPDDYADCIFIAEHGSWNRKEKIGYRISMVRLDKDGHATSYESFIEGWLDRPNDEVYGRPVDLEWMSDGSLLITDDYADLIYRVTYQG